MKADVSHFKIFGCIAYVHIPDELRTKLDPKAEKCIIVGYSLDQKGYRCYNPITREIRVSRDVVFDELSSWYGKQKLIQVDAEKDDAQGKGVQQESQVISGPGESPRTSSKSVNPWSGRLRQSNVSPGSAESKAATTKGKEKVEQSMIGFDARHSSSDESLDEELGIPRLNTPSVRKMQGGEGLCRSTQVKYPV